MNIPPIKGFIENTLIDWEGKIAGVLFLPGCNFRCRYCHASALVLSPSELETIPFEAIRNHVLSNNGWIDGVVITGGEACLHENLENLIDELKERLKLSIKLDTNGSQPEVLKRLIKAGKVDAVSMDVKAPLDEQKYNEVTGVETNLEKISESIDFLLSRSRSRSCFGGADSLRGDIEVEFRTTVCPAFLDEEDVVEIARSIRGAPRYVLQEFRPLGCIDKRMQEVAPYPLSHMEKILASVKKYIPEAYIRGHKKQSNVASRRFKVK